MDTITVHGLFVFDGCGLEITISSNMGAYLLPAGARRAAAVLLLRALFPAAGPEPATAPWPRQRFHATTSRGAMPKLEYGPTTIPTTTATEQTRSTWPPIRNK